MGVVAAVTGAWVAFYNRMVDLKIPLPEPTSNPEVFGYQNPQFVESDDENEV